MDYQSNSPVDLGRVQTMIGTDLDLFKSLVDIFTEEADKQLRLIEDAVRDQDPESLNKSAHSFKSSLATLGAYEASKFAGQLEVMGKSGSVEGVLEIFTKLNLEYKKVGSFFKSDQWIIEWNLISS